MREIEQKLDRIEEKLDEALEFKAKTSTEIKWFKSIGSLFMSALVFLYSKVYGGP